MTSNEKAKAWVRENVFQITNAGGDDVLSVWVSGEVRPVSSDAVRSIVRKAGAGPITNAEIRAEARHVVTRGFFPGEGRIVEQSGFPVLNLWSEHKIHAGNIYDTDRPLNPIWGEFLTLLFPVAAERQYVEEYVAVLCMRPKVQMDTSVILRSLEQGVGKNMLLDHIIGKGMLGGSLYATISLADAKQRFNSHLVGRRLVHIEEVYTTRDGLASANALKGLVTATRIKVEPKGVDAFFADMNAGFFISSNDRRPISLEATDRRWFVPEVIGLPFQGDDTTRMRFFDRLADVFEDEEELKALGRHFELICRRLEAEGGKGFGQFRRAPSTDAKADLVGDVVRTEQLEELRELLLLEASKHAFQVNSLLKHFNRSRENTISQRDITDALADVGYERTRLRLSGKSTTAYVHKGSDGNVLLWVSPFESRA